jgi:uncharacterized protein DUF3501
MQPLTYDDLIPLDEYVNRRREFFESHTGYVDRYRRVRIGPRLTLVFENRQTLWYRLQEVIRIARLSEPRRVQRELDLYNRFLPGRNQLQAILLVSVPPEAPVTEELAFWQRLEGEDLRLCVGAKRFPSTLLTCRPEDRCIGAALWVQFHLDDFARRLLADGRNSACFEAHYENYRHHSQPLSDDVRQSLLDDLELSDRDAG